jgi:hypothetical protein
VQLKMRNRCGWWGGWKSQRNMNHRQENSGNFTDHRKSIWHENQAREQGNLLANFIFILAQLNLI